jgi:retron-type reverse transcriptase
MSPKPTMNDNEQSDELVVPTKLPNEACPRGQEATEGRSSAKGNTGQQNAPRTQSRTSAPSALARVRQAAKRDKKKRFTALLHHVTIDLLRAAFLSLSRRAAAGVDGVTWSAYAQDLEARLVDLHGRVQRGAYRAKPSRRVFIPKSDGQQRPLGIAALEDKVVQRAVVEVLNAIYESDFLGFSYGFRPGRSQHQALDALATAIQRKKVNWVLDADIRGFFDTIDHGWLRKFVEHRIGDSRVIGAEHESDAMRLRVELQQRLERFGLELHAEKTRLLRFGRKAEEQRRARGESAPETFDFLGFTHICGRSRQGWFLLCRHTTSKRMRTKLKEIREELMKRRHAPISAQGAWIGAVVRGYFAYHAVPTNSRRLSSFRYLLTRSWLHALRRRSQRRRVTWERMERWAKRWIPPARISHPFPWDRFDDRTRGRSRVR